MAQDSKQINGVFQALADPTRRAVLGRLSGASFDVVETWLSQQRELWEGRTDRLEQVVTNNTDQKEEPE